MKMSTSSLQLLKVPTFLHVLGYPSSSLPQSPTSSTSHSTASHICKFPHSGHFVPPLPS
ncbi:uncharacterized protein LAESUDRAFT_731060 [Laetiporus sulphureus 93-53]|uniref:Uncharacterized protein n=1 Tax=Laetiporus sulphureus 93-53 TaxID=1314785 RepID=A0A165BTQ8_9APHY|nr:uncharacterized protein LAESUDRAFT_731060 [Laetiporus sulphureus 93-53]KZT01634.1 hypothetical protein LAESUDRAFT_731060 [Laetiporus sulphureus 93-53]